MDKKKRVIIFEDEEPLKDLFTLVIERHGCEVDFYESPFYFPVNQCIECLKNGSKRCADILLTDIVMPVVSGLDFIEDWLTKGCKIPQIGIMSGYWTDDKIIRAKKLGGTILEKPVPVSTLSSWLKECINKIDNAKKIEYHHSEY